MLLLISAVVAFLLSAVSQMQKDLAMDPVDAPAWTWQPTPGKAILAGCSWFIRPILNGGYYPGNRARAVAFGLFSSGAQMLVATGYVWCCLRVPMAFLDSIILRMIASVVLFFVTAPIVMPLLALLMIPLTLLVAFPLDFLFPGNVVKKRQS